MNLVRQEAALTRENKLAIEASLVEAERLVTLEREAYISELSMLRVLASAGTTVLIFDHMLRAMGGQLLDVVDKLGTAACHLPEDQKHSFQQTLDDLTSWSSMATGQGSLLGLLVGPDTRSRKTSLAIHPVVESLKRGFSAYTNRFGISLENAVPPEVRTPPLHEAELYAVFLNILTNAFKAVRETADRRVCVEASATPQDLTLRVHDTGIGVPRSMWEEAFEPFVTTSQPDPVLGVGTGLGLKIVHDFVRVWGGNAHFADPIDPWKTTIEIVIPVGGVV